MQYAKIEYSKEYNQNVLKKANELSKNQSYVLYNIPKELLDKLKLPLGKFKSKEEIGIPNITPLYVIGFNKETNELIVGYEKELYKKEFIVLDVNWLLFDKLEKELLVYVKTRYSSKAYKAKVIPYGNNIKVIYDEPQKSITEGQSAVFYIDNIVIGGGKIR